MGLLTKPVGFTRLCYAFPKPVIPRLPLPQTTYMQARKPSDSYTMMTEIVLPNDTNVFGNLMGGRLMYWMDIAAAIAAQRHCKCAGGDGFG